MKTVCPRVGNRKVLHPTINSTIYVTNIYRVLECIVTTGWPYTRTSDGGIENGN